MKCFYHPNQAATSTCCKCGKALCKTCTSFFNPSMCVECAEKTTNEVRTEAKSKLTLLIIALCVGFILGFIFGCLADGISTGIVGSIYGAFTAFMWIGIPFGWKALNNITPSIFLILPIIGWVIYFFIKLFLSEIIGGFVLIIKIKKLYDTLHKTSELTEYINNTQNIVND